MAGPGFIHIGTSDRGFDEAWSKEMTSERKEIVFRGGIQRTVWRRISTSQSSLPGVLRWEEATAEQVARASATKSTAKFADLDKVIECVPLVDPELKTTVLSRVRQKCSLARDVAASALNELCVRGRIFHRTIPNPKPKVRGFAAWCRTNGTDEGSDPSQPAPRQETPP